MAGVVLPRPEQRLLGVEVTRILREAILGGTLGPGRKLTEMDLSRDLDISRGVLRQALHALEDEGLVISAPHKGARVATITPADLLEVLSIRERLEPLAVERAMGAEGPSLAAPLRELQAEMAVAGGRGNERELTLAHTRFHAVFYTHSGHELLARLWNRFEGPMAMFLRIGQTTFPKPTEVAPAHERIVELVEADDVPALLTEIDAHLRVNLEYTLGLVGTDSGSAYATRRSPRPKRSMG